MKIMNLFQNGSGPAPSCRAIEIGTSAIRVAALKRSGRIPRLTDYRQLPLLREKAGPAPAELVREGLRNLVQGTRIKEDMITTSLPLHQVFIRLLEVPFSRVAQIRQVISSEAELHVPFPLDDVIIDFWVVEELPEGKSRVMMSAVKKTVLEDRLRLLAEAGISPTRVNLDLLGASRSVIDSPLIDPDQVTVLLEIGAGHSGAAFLLGGRVVFLRSISWGGDSVTAAIAETAGVSFAAAEDLKLASDPGISASIFSAAYELLGGELLRTVTGASAPCGGRSPSGLVLTGGGSRSPGLGEYLTKKTGLKVLEVNPSDRVRSRRDPPGPESSVAIGLALSGIAPTSDRVDFRREEFAFTGGWKKIRRRLLLTAFLTAGVLVLLALAFFWKIGMEEREVQNLDRRIRQIVRLTFPDAPVPVPGQELKAMEEELEKSRLELRHYRELVSVSALDILREISRMVPESIKVQVVVMDIDTNRVVFRGRTNNYRSADLVKNALTQSEYFAGDKIRETRDSKTLQKGGELVTVEFEYLIPLALREEGK